VASRFAQVAPDGSKLVLVPGRAVLLPSGTAPFPVAAPTCGERAAGLCDINWQSAPAAFMPLPLPEDWQKARERGSAQTLLSTESGTPLVLVRRGEVLLAFETSDETLDAPGARLLRWPYFNYLLHVAASQALGQPPVRFAAFAHSPLPGKSTRNLIWLAVVLGWGLVLLLYRLARRRGAVASEAAKQFLQAVTRARRGGDSAEAGSATSGASAPPATLPFARPLSGLLTLLANMLVLIGPYFALQSVLARRVQPFPEADGLWRTTTDALFILWMTFDLGTQTAFVKYFAEHRASADQTVQERALSDVQFYIWFQIFSRLIEATLLVGLGLGYLPLSSYALYAPLVLLYAGTCQPAFPAVGKFLCQAMQRFDYYNLLDFLESRLLSFLVPVPFILFFRAYGKSHPALGEAYGAALGMGIGGFATSLLVLAMGLFALSRLGLPVRSLFLAQFGRDTARRQLWFGLKLTLGQEPFRLTSFLESLIIIRWLRDFPTWLGIRDLLHNRLTFLYFFAWSFYQSAVPAVSEALSTGKKHLVQYYLSRYLQLGMLFSVTVFSLLLATGGFYVTGALGGQWAVAEKYLVLASLSGLLLPWAWLTDSLQQGAGRTGTTMIIMLVEQALRLGLLLLFVGRFQFVGIYLAALSALLIKCTLAWTINHYTIVRLQVSLRSTLFAPALAAACNFAFFRAVTWLFGALGLHDPYVSIGLFFVAGVGSILICLFLLGVCGGLDAVLQDELRQAAALSAVLRPLCRLLAGAALAGARLSPYTPPAPASWETARGEAAELEGVATRPAS
jgi:O-antigen/teichoic acid export membrane protein